MDRCAPESTPDVLHCERSVSTSTPLHQELSVYTSESTIARSESPLTWWTANCHLYPHIAEVARCLLSVPATAISTRRLYTKHGDEILDNRNSLSCETAERAMFIMWNLWTWRSHHRLNWSKMRWYWTIETQCRERDVYNVKPVNLTSHHRLNWSKMWGDIGQ